MTGSSRRSSSSSSGNNGSVEEKGILAGLLDAKNDLAKAIAWQTIPILQDSEMQKAGWEVAREKLRQQLLINLKEGYSINVVVQYNFSANNAGGFCEILGNNFKM